MVHLASGGAPAAAAAGGPVAALDVPALLARQVDVLAEVEQVGGAVCDQGPGDDVDVEHEGPGNAGADGVGAEAGEVVPDAGDGAGVDDELEPDPPVLARRIGDGAVVVDVPEQRSNDGVGAGLGGGQARASAPEPAARRRPARLAGAVHGDDGVAASSMLSRIASTSSVRATTVMTRCRRRGWSRRRGVPGAPAGGGQRRRGRGAGSGGAPRCGTGPPTAPARTAAPSRRSWPGPRGR